jgi:PAS domain S-box-containing protein
MSQGAAGAAAGPSPAGPLGEALGVTYLLDPARGALLALAGRVAWLGRADGAPPGPWADLVHEADRAAVEAAHAAAAGVGGTFDLEHRVVRPDGVVLRVRDLGRAVEGGLLEGLLLPATAPDDQEPGRPSFLAAMLEAIPDPIFVKDHEHRWLAVNRAFCEFMGHPREALLGRTDRDFFAPVEADVFWAKDDVVLRTGEVNENEEAFTDAAGVRHVISTKKQAFTDGRGRPFLIGVIRDVTARRAAEAALRESEERFRSIFADGPLGMAVIDLDLRLRRVNGMLCRLLGLDEDALLDRTLQELTHPEDRTSGHDTAEHLLAGRLAYQTSERRLFRADGGVVWVSLTLSLIVGEDEEPRHFLAMVEDVSERKRAEAALLEARDAALRSAQAKSRFIANVSHELRTPLNAVLGMTSLLLDGSLAPEQRDCVEVIRASGDALLTLMNDVLDFSKLERDRVELEARPFDLRECIEGALELVAPHAAEKRVALGYLLSPAAPARVEGDTTRLRQVLVNLLSNAVKFTEAGEVRLEVVADGATARFAVPDSGIGIPPDRLDRLFRPFSQVDASTTRQYGGTGLGLAICRRLVELMGGRIEVESKVGVGSTFSFTAHLPPLPAPPAPPAPAGLTGRRLLVVDPAEVVRRFVAEAARAWAMDVLEAASAAAALEAVRGGAVALVLVDRDLAGAADPGGTDGAVEVARALRGVEPRAAIALLTPVGRAGSERLRGLFDGQLKKPLELAPLQALLRALGGEGAARASVAPRIDAHLAVQAPLQILVVDDTVVNQRVAVRLLERMGYRPDAAGSGPEALGALQRRAYDLVLLDLHMPGMDGLETARRIQRLLPPPRRPRIVALTADALLGDRERCLAAGMDDFVSKPVRVEELQAVLRRASSARGGGPGGPDAVE